MRKIKLFLSAALIFAVAAPISSLFAQDVLLSVSTIKHPSKTEYTLPITTESIDYSDGVLQKNYRSGKKETVNMSSLKATITGLDTKKVGDQRIMLNFTIDGKLFPYMYTINVKDSLKNISLVSNPTKFFYVMPFSNAGLDLTGGVIRKNFYSGATEDIKMEGKTYKFKTSSYDTTKIGYQSSTLLFFIAHGNLGYIFEYEYGISVLDSIKEVKVLRGPCKKEYTLPFTKADLNLDCMSLQAYLFHNQDFGLGIKYCRYTISGLDTSKLGEQELTVNFEISNGAYYVGTTSEYKYTITIKDTIKEIKVTSAPTKTEYTMPFTERDLDLSGGVITKSFYVGTSEYLNMNEYGRTVSGLNPTQLGNQEISLTLYIDGKPFEYKYQIEVKDAVKSFVAVSAPTKKEYIQGEELKVEEVLDGADLSLVWHSGKEETLSIGAIIDSIDSDTLLNDLKSKYGLEVILFSTETTGTKNIVVKYGEFSVSWNVEVVAKAEEETPGVGEEPGSGDEGGSGEEPGEGEGGEGDDDPIVAVEDLAAGGAVFEAWASCGVLSVKVERGGVLEVFSPSGVLVRREEVAAGGRERLPLERGVYVLRLGGEVKKVVVD